MAMVDLNYQALPEAVKHNLTEEQFQLALVDLIPEGERIPETTQYIDLGSGVMRIYQQGEIAPGNLLPTHDLSGARGKDSTQFQT